MGFDAPKRPFDSFHTPVTESGCWIWLGAVNPKGYGVFNMGKFDGKWRNSLAHRAAWMFAYGEIPKGMFVCHKCDTPSCVNPKHLFLGTPRDNMLDKVRKGRDKNGKEKQTHCKRGHPLPPAEKRKWRMCATCREITWRAWYERTKNGKV